MKLLVVGVAIALAGSRGSAFADKVTVSAGSMIVLPAEPATAYVGKATTVFTGTPSDPLDIDVAPIESAIDLQHYAKLFARAKVTPAKTSRYAVVRVSHVAKVENYSDVPRADLVVASVSTGWALYAIVEGPAASFTLDAARALAKSPPTGKIVAHVVPIGLVAKTAGKLPVALTADAIKASYTIGKDAPIAVRWQYTKATASDGIAWTSPPPEMPEECVRYKAMVDRVIACPKMKPSSDAMKAGFDTTWNALLAAPAASREAMRPGCKAGAEAIEQSLDAMGC